MTILREFLKQPREQQFYDFDLTEWLDGIGDLIDTFTVTNTPGVSLSYSTKFPDNKRIRVFYTGGQAGKTYKVTLLFTTLTLRVVKEFEIIINVVEQ
jgi:hypothetical protein